MAVFLFTHFFSLFLFKLKIKSHKSVVERENNYPIYRNNNNISCKLLIIKKIYLSISTNCAYKKNMREKKFNLLSSQSHKNKSRSGW